MNEGASGVNPYAKGANAGIGLYSSYQQTKANRYNVKTEAARAKTARLKENRDTMAPNLAQGGASCFAQSGNLVDINNANALTLESDIGKIDTQASTQIKLAKLAGKGQMASIFGSAATSIYEQESKKNKMTESIGSAQPSNDIANG